MFKKILKKLWRMFKVFLGGIFWFSRDYFRYYLVWNINKPEGSLKIFPQVFDKDPKSHTFDKHYVYMDRWAFKHLLNARPPSHVDVGSSIRFLSMVSIVTKLEFVDIRPITLDFDNFTCIEGSILSLPFKDNFVDSLSCLHVAEHIGLGRYGDPLDPLGTKKACAELARVLKPGGRLYFALPVGKTVTYFNAHRVHSPKLILEYFKSLKFLEFAVVNDQGRFLSHAHPNDYENANYACGMFIFTKIQ